MPLDFSQKIYLKNLAKECGEANVSAYILDMEEFDGYLFDKFKFKIADLKRNSLKPYQVNILLKLNPSDFEINSMKELNEYEAWEKWFSEVKNYQSTQ